ncbi:MAG: hypothetical protein OEP52_02550, partial [Acidimicrobiia bacterium]|nr:hypothetical protein [Acidimicrobiia bacterium]
MSDRFRYILALVVGLLAIPGLAFATTSVLSSDDRDETAETQGTVTTSTLTTDSSVISAEDLVRACGVEGHFLVDLEAAGTIDDIQRAALHALRPICDEAGLPLADGPVAEGATIAGGAPPGSAYTRSATTLTTLANQDDGNAAAALAVRERALEEIDKAMAVGGKVEKINRAIALIEQGDTAYAAASYDQAGDLYGDAE